MITGSNIQGAAMKTADFESAKHWRVWDCTKPFVRDEPIIANVGCWLLGDPDEVYGYYYYNLNLLRLLPGDGWEIFWMAMDMPSLTFGHTEPDLSDLRPLKTPVWSVRFGSVSTDVEAEAVAIACIHAIITEKAYTGSRYSTYWHDTIPKIAAHYAAHRHD